MALNSIMAYYNREQRMQFGVQVHVQHMYRLAITVFYYMYHMIRYGGISFYISSRIDLHGGRPLQLHMLYNTLLCTAAANIILDPQ